MRDLNVEPEIIKLLCAEKINLNIDLVCRLTTYLEMSVDFWVGLQKTYEIDLAKLLNRNLNYSQTILPYKHKQNSLSL